MNMAHVAYYANLVLEALDMETLVVAYWQGLWEGKLTEWIAKKNDEFRVTTMQGLKSDTGKAVRTRGVAALGSFANIYIQSKIAEFSEWTADNDPYGEHDFGSIEIDGLPKIFWKIDYYANADIEYGTADRLNAYRVLVIMLADEY